MLFSQKNIQEKNSENCISVLINATEHVGIAFRVRLLKAGPLARS